MKFRIRTVLVGTVVALLAATVGSLLFFWGAPVESEAIRIAHQVIRQDAESLSLEIGEFLAPAQHSTSITADLIANDSLVDLDRHFFAVLDSNIPELDGYHFGSEDGSFLFVVRDDSFSDGGYLTKRIVAEPERRVDLTWHDNQYRVTRNRDGCSGSL